MADPDWSRELACWLRLERTPGVGAETARRLLAQFGLPGNIFRADHSALAVAAGERAARALLTPPPDDTRALIEQTLAWAAQPGNHVLTLADSAYPRSLLDIADPPLMLYAKGCIELLRARTFAVVGSRNATTQGMLNAERFSEILSQARLTIVSGMALGIDTAAHRGGLRGTGSTIAVIGTGANIIYPARNRALAHEIATGGCLLSEYPLGTPAIPSNFPRRNRIISGLASGVLVVEAAAHSGSLITARLAAEQGRDVFAIPGSIHSPLSKGCHLLIKQGAKLVESAQDVLEELQYMPSSTQSPQTEARASAAPDAGSLLAALGFDPVSPEALAGRCGFDMARVQAQLLTLEMEGMVEMLPGGMLRRLATS
jgi:DNA processing protein